MPPPAGTVTKAPASAPRQLTFRGDVVRVEISPDGRYMAYVSNERLLLRNLANGNETTVHRARYIRSLDFAPDGDRLLYMTAQKIGIGTGTGATYVYSLTDKRRRRVGPATTRACFASTNEIATSAMGSKGNKRIFLWGIAHGSRRSIPFEGDYIWIESIDCSPQRKRLVVVTSTATRSQLWTIGSNGRGRKKLLDDSPIQDVAWSVDGTSVYFIKQGGAGGELRRLDIAADGSARGTSRLVVTDVEGPSWFSGAGRFSKTSTWSPQRPAKSSSCWPSRWAGFSRPRSHPAATRWRCFGTAGDAASGSST